MGPGGAPRVSVVGSLSGNQVKLPTGRMAAIGLEARVAFRGSAATTAFTSTSASTSRLDGGASTQAQRTQSWSRHEFVEAVIVDR